MSKYRDQSDDKEKAALDKLTALRESGYDGWIGPDGEPATRANTPPRVWEAIQTPFQDPADHR